MSGTALAAALAGCGGSSDDQSTEPDDGGNGGAPAATDTPTETATATATSTPTPQPVEPTQVELGETYEGETTEQDPSEPTYGDHADPYAIPLSEERRVKVTLQSDAFTAWFAWYGPDGSYIGQYYEGDNGAVGIEFVGPETTTVWATSERAGLGEYTISFEDVTEE